MLIVLAMILFIAWLLGVAGPFAVGASIHLLLVIVMLAFAVGLSGRHRLI